MCVWPETDKYIGKVTVKWKQTVQEQIRAVVEVLKFL